MNPVAGLISSAVGASFTDEEPALNSNGPTPAAVTPTPTTLLPNDADNTMHHLNATIEVGSADRRALRDPRQARIVANAISGAIAPRPTLTTMVSLNCKQRRSLI